MKQILFFLTVFGILIIFSCQKEEFTYSENKKDELLTTRSNQLPSGIGLQKINDNQTTNALIRGIGVGLPYFFPYNLDIKSGTWVTLAFSFNRFVNKGDCPEKVTDEMRNEFHENAKSYLKEIAFQLYWDGEPLDVLEYFRPEYIKLEMNEKGECVYNIPWRYYVVPQNKGAHTLKMVAWDGLEFSRKIIWESGKVK